MEASHARCRDLKVPVEQTRPQKILPKIELAPRLAENSLLLTAAEQVITSNHYGYIYILCDPELVALKIFAAPEVLGAGEEAGVKPGTVFDEKSCGTNAPALAKEHQRLVAVRGEQHYGKLFKNWWCVAGPVREPAGNVIGYLNISVPAKKEPVSTIPLLQSLIESIGDKFLLLNLHRVDSRQSLLPPEITRELTRREQEVFQLILKWLDDAEIARKLSLSIGTTKTHRWNIYRKLGVSNLRELLAKLSR